MKEKPLDLVTWENITIAARYDIDVVANNTSNYYSRYSMTRVPAFCEPEELTGEYNNYSKVVSPKLVKEVKTLGRTFEIDVIRMLEGVHSDMLFTELQDMYPDIAAILKKRMPKDWFEKANAGAIAKRETYKTIVQKQYDELLTVFTKCKSKTDISTMEDIDELYYCEAAGFMDKLETRIFKKNNPKNLKLYNTLKDIRNEDIITCSEG